ncbi:MAG: hypothetical protein R2827_08850 [Bdellovibrionales bacterium]
MKGAKASAPAVSAEPKKIADAPKQAEKERELKAPEQQKQSVAPETSNTVKAATKKTVAQKVAPKKFS